MVVISSDEPGLALDFPQKKKKSTKLQSGMNEGSLKVLSELGQIYST